jgi:molecular chaperone GrpE
MIEKDMPTRNRIPVRFMDEESDAGGEETRDGGMTPEELGRASSYESETEMRQRTDANDDEAPPAAELPENREEQDTLSRDKREARDESHGRDEADASAHAKHHPGVSSEVELIAAQAEARLLEDELRKAKSERQELHDLVARRQADFENYRKRMERERGETYSRVAGEVARQILPVLDNLHRAVETETSVESVESEEFHNFLHGVALITKQLNGVLENLGVVPVETVGQPFDPHVHEAVATEQTEEFEPDTITQEIQRGYRIGDKLLRPAMVKVATR